MKINLKINLLLLTLGILATLVITSLQYYVSKSQVIENAFNEAELINSFALASREYTVNTMRPLAAEIAGPEAFHPELMGGFFVARAIAENFAKVKPGYYFKQATLDPINEANRANVQEKQVIEYFINNRKTDLKKGVIEKEGRKLFFMARPIVAQKGCLKCHGSKDSAPRQRVEKYPGSGGYGYKADSVVAGFFTYVPVQKAMGRLETEAMKTASVGIGVTLFVLFCIWLFIGRFITRPIRELTAIAEQISKGKSLKKELPARSNDEIGALYQSFDRMRKSVIKLIQMVQKKK